MRILISGQTYHPALNGQAVFTVHLAEGLAQAGHQVLVIAPSDVRQAYCVSRSQLRVEKLAAAPFGRGLGDVYLNLPAGRQVSRLFGEFQPDIVHIQDHYPLCRAVLAAGRRRRIAVVGTNHFLPENILHYLKMPRWASRPLTYLAWRWVLDVYNRVDVATTPTETAASILRRQYPRPPVYPISCGVDLAQFRPDGRVDGAALRRRYGLAEDRTLFLFVGRLDQEKRLEVLLRAMACLDRADVQLAIAGRGRHAGVLHALAQELNLDHRVVFTGFVPAEDLPGLLNSADIFAMPSEAELQSIATLEALACGRPVLAANARALPELVKNGINGYLFEPGNHHEAARRMSQLADERRRWAEMGAASLATARLHSVEGTVRRYEELYRYALELRRGASNVRSQESGVRSQTSDRE
jgi:glycosyltransferase involved in cell wall biosynthesis